MEKNQGGRAVSLLNDFARKCILLDKSRVPDGAGGYVVTWSDGAEFLNYQSVDTSMEARRAEKEGVTSVYSALVDKSVPIEYGDYYKDVESGETYRVTSDPEAKRAPRSSSFELKFFTSERKALPS
nr:MAG TPA: head closure knob [Caudoviricetes sp.]